jgi:hypothetical protein
MDQLSTSPSFLASIADGQASAFECDVKAMMTKHCPPWPASCVIGFTRHLIVIPGGDERGIDLRSMNIHCWSSPTTAIMAPLSKNFLNTLSRGLTRRQTLRIYQNLPAQPTSSLEAHASHRAIYRWAAALIIPSLLSLLASR